MGVEGFFPPTDREEKATGMSPEGNNPGLEGFLGKNTGRDSHRSLFFMM